MHRVQEKKNTTPPIWIDRGMGFQSRPEERRGARLRETVRGRKVAPDRRTQKLTGTCTPIEDVKWGSTRPGKAGTDSRDELLWAG